MLSVGKTESYLRRKLKEKGALYFILVDPDKVSPEKAGGLAKMAEESGADAVLVGGTLGVTAIEVERTVEEVKKKTKLPVILFPGNVSSLSKKADAVLFISLLNSSNPYFIVGAQAAGAWSVYKMGLEAIPTGYLIVGNEGGGVGYIGQARLIPYERVDLAVAYGLAAKYLGMRFLYLEAGSGAKAPIPASFITSVKKTTELVLIVGGGIRDRESAYRAVVSGADIIVTGNVLEGEDASKVEESVREISEGVSAGGRVKLASTF